MNSPEHSSLGKTVAYPEHYDPSVLFAIPRAPKRAELGINATLPFYGVDVWNAYELSWLDSRGKPEIALAEFRVPATSPAIIESKSFKLYLASFTQERLDAATLQARLIHDLSTVVGAAVGVRLVRPNVMAGERLRELDGELIDTLDLAVDDFGPPKPEYLSGVPDTKAEETLVSHLLKSNCPVTGQPDWASVQVHCGGVRLDRTGLLRYLVSFRRHTDFHEQCVERIYMDLMRFCAPRRLSVYARYTRRGGLDINPFRSSRDEAPSNLRTPRQ